MIVDFFGVESFYYRMINFQYSLYVNIYGIYLWNEWMNE